MTLSNYMYNLNNGETFSYLKNGKKVQVGDTSETRGAGVGTVQKLSIEQITEQFMSGNMILMEAVNGLKANGARIVVSSKVANNGKNHQITFQYQGKTYIITCNKEAAISQIDEKAVTVYAKTEVEKLPKEIINKYFDIALKQNGQAMQYSLKPNCGYTSLNQLKNDLYQQYKNDLILDNFLTGRGMENSTGLMKTESGKYVISTNYVQLADEIKLATGNEAKQLRKKAFNKFIKEFASGNVTTTQAMNILKAIGVESQTRKTVNGNYEYTIKFEGKTYTVTCNKDAAAKADDDKTVQTFDKNTLRNKYGLNEEALNQYFDVVAQEGNTGVVYKPKNKSSLLGALLEGDGDVKLCLEIMYPKLMGNVLDSQTIETISNNYKAFIQAKPNATDSELAILIDTQVELTQMAESKDVDKTQYIQNRIADFTAMRLENPNMTLDEMNEILGQTYVIESIANELYTGYSIALGTDLVNSCSDLSDLRDYALMEGDNNPMAKLMYYETQTLGYLSLAQDGILTQQQYLDYTRMDLLQTFPGFLDLTETNKMELYNKICCLTPEEIDRFQKEILNLPSCEDPSYISKLNGLLYEFDCATVGRETYVPKNASQEVSYEEIFKTRYGENFNPDDIIEYKQFEANAQAAIMMDSARNEIIAILDSATTEDAMSEAIFAVLFMLTGSTDDKVLTEKLQELTGMQNIEVIRGQVILSLPPIDPMMQATRTGGQTIDDVKNNLKNGINSNTDSSIKTLTKNEPEESKGFFGEIGDMFGQFSAEYIAPVVDAMGLSQETLDYIEIGAGIVAGVAFVAGCVMTCGGLAVAAGGVAVTGGTLFATAGVVGAVSAGASYASGVKELNDLYESGDIELYDEYGNWAPDENAQMILDNMETDAALAVVDLLSGGLGAKVASSAKVANGAANFLTNLGVNAAKVGQYTGYAQAAISNGINATANMTAAGALTGDGNIGTNMAFAGLGAFVDIKSANGAMKFLKDFDGSTWWSKPEYERNIDKILTPDNLQIINDFSPEMGNFTKDVFYNLYKRIANNELFSQAMLEDVVYEIAKAHGIEIKSTKDLENLIKDIKLCMEDFDDWKPLRANADVYPDRIDTEYALKKQNEMLNDINKRNKDTNDFNSNYTTKNPNNKGATTWGISTLRAVDGIIIDKNKDIELQKIISEIKDATKNMSSKEKADYLYNYMVNKFGTSRGSDISKTNSANFPRGKMLGDIFSNPELIELTVCRHRALLFKVLADEIGLPTEVHYGQYGSDHTPHVWNFVKLDGNSGYVYDTMLGNNALGNTDSKALGGYHFGGNIENNYYLSKNKPSMMANGLAVAATVAGSLNLTDANAQETPTTPQLPQEPVNVSTRETEQNIDASWGDGETEKIPNGKLSETIIEIGGDKKIKVDILTNGQGEVASTEVNTLCQNGEITPEDLVQAIGAIESLVKSGKMSQADGEAKVQALRGALANMLGDSEMADTKVDEHIPEQIQGYGNNTIWVPDGKGGYASKQVSEDYKKALANLMNAGMPYDQANMLLDYLNDTFDYNSISKLANNFDINVKSDGVVSLVQKAENKLKSEVKQNISDWISMNCKGGDINNNIYMVVLGINANTSLADLEKFYAILSSGALNIEVIPGEGDVGAKLIIEPISDYGKEMEQYMSGYDDEGHITYSDDWDFYQNIMNDMQDDAIRLANALVAWYDKPAWERGDMPSSSDYLDDYEDRIAYHQFNQSSFVNSLV